ncbi:MAG: MoxR family ATPase, partial [Candidatus Thermoplasmatota archaeon]|nr:MoxR family ATPase [Candidatus Thermoplasmatota archaeon]
LGKELIRLNITIETDEDDLLGGFRLVNGETKFVPGPVIEAMERGCTLLLDECDLGSNKLMALQPVLEGKGVFLKKVNKWVTPKDGFNVIATANTKGKGSDDGRFIGTNVLNEAFLERFPVTLEQSYPSPATEVKMLLLHSASVGCHDEKFIQKLVDWADIIRKTFY